MNIQFDFDRLEDRCLAPIEDFTIEGTVTETNDGIYIYKNNNSRVLGVCHLDSVLDLTHFYLAPINGDNIVLNAQLDDRLGAYVLLDLLPSLGLNFDVLLTEGEERGRSTAAWFESEKKYNWIFSFDRRGTGVVLYQYSGGDWENALKKSKFTIHQGTFSDVSSMEHLGVKCVNIGTGYHGEHDDLCFASMNELTVQVEKFTRFYGKYKDTRFKYDKPRYSPAKWGNMGNYSERFLGWGDSSTLYTRKDMCYLCLTNVGTVEIVTGIHVCNDCFTHADMCAGCDDIVYDTQLLDGLCSRCR